MALTGFSVVRYDGGSVGSDVTTVASNRRLWRRSRRSSPNNGLEAVVVFLERRLKLHPLTTKLLTNSLRWAHFRHSWLLSVRSSAGWRLRFALVKRRRQGMFLGSWWSPLFLGWTLALRLELPLLRCLLLAPLPLFRFASYHPLTPLRHLSLLLLLEALLLLLLLLGLLLLLLLLMLFRHLASQRLRLLPLIRELLPGSSQLPLLLSCRRIDHLLRSSLEGNVILASQ